MCSLKIWKEKSIFLIRPGGSNRRLDGTAVDRQGKSGTERYGPVKDAARRQRLTGLQRAAVHGELHDAAHKVVGGDLPTPMKDGFY